MALTRGLRRAILFLMKTYVLAIAAAAAATILAETPAISLTCDRQVATYAAGERVAFTVSTTCDGAPTSLPVKVTARYPGTTGTSEVVETATAPDGTLRLSYEPKAPGWVYVEAMANMGKGKPAPRARAGAIYRPDDIRPGLPPPDDFRAYWDAEIAKLDKVPIKVKLDPVELTEKESCGGKDSKCFHIRYHNWFSKIAKSQ